MAIPDELSVQEWAGVTLQDAEHDQLHAAERGALNMLRGAGIPLVLHYFIGSGNTEHPGVEMPGWGGYYFLTNSLAAMTPPASADPLVATFMFPVAGILAYEGHYFPRDAVGDIDVGAELEVYPEPAAGWGDGSDISHWADEISEYAVPIHPTDPPNTPGKNIQDELVASVSANSRLLVGVYMQGVTDPPPEDWVQGAYMASFRFFPTG